MHILLTNDDGLKAPGLQTLKRELASHDCRLTVVAPNGQRSAASHSMTINKALYCRDESTVQGIREIAVSGTPVDCVKMAMEYFLKEDKPDLIISGINDGYNLGSDVLYLERYSWFINSHEEWIRQNRRHESDPESGAGTGIAGIAAASG